MANEIHADSFEFQRQMGSLMSEALKTPDGMRALAAAIAPPIEQTIKQKEITSLLLTQGKLPVGESAKYQKKPKVRVYWISPNGNVAESELDEEEIEFPIRRIAGNPMIDVSVLQNGNVGRLNDMQVATGNEIRKKIDGKTVTLISGAVPESNTITLAGGKLTAAGMDQAMTVLEDMEMSTKYILMRGKHISELRQDADLDPVTARELNQKGIFNRYNGAEIINSASVPQGTVLLLPDEEIGKFPIRKPIAAEPTNEPKRFKAGWVVWMEAAQCITRPDLLTKISIT